MSLKIHRSYETPVHPVVNARHSMSGEWFIDNDKDISIFVGDIVISIVKDGRIVVFHPGESCDLTVNRYIDIELKILEKSGE